jgi:hypothetical protein
MEQLTCPDQTGVETVLKPYQHLSPSGCQGFPQVFQSIEAIRNWFLDQDMATCSGCRDGSF